MESENNPYQPPRSNVAMPDEPRALELAGKGRRFGTFVVDYLGNILLLMSVAVLGMVIFGSDPVLAVVDDWSNLAFVPLMFLYYVFFEGIWGRTPGKWLFGTIVVRPDGTKPSLAQVLGRSACRFIPFEPFSCFGEVGWHDGIPKTRVVRARRS